jgi:CheY-like chemotaxis protein
MRKYLGWPANGLLTYALLLLRIRSPMQRFFDIVNRVLGRSDAPLSAHQEGREEDGQIRQSTGRVALVVDDDPLMRGALCEHLRQNNFSAMEAATAADGYEQVLKWRERVSVLITDMVIPGGGGWQLVQNARNIVPNLVVIFISGAIDEQVLASATSHSRTGFLEKPFELSQLTDVLNSLLSDRTEQDQKAG